MLKKGDWLFYKSAMISASILPFSNNTGDFKYSIFSKIIFEGWEEYSESDEYPQDEISGDDYLEAHLSVVFWKVFDKLIEENQFQKLKMASPFYLGFSFHDEDQLILRIINW